VSTGPKAGVAITAEGAGLCTCGAATFPTRALCAFGWNRCQPAIIQMASSKPAIPPTRTKGKGFFGCAGNTASPTTGRMSGAETVGAVAGTGPAISHSAAFWRNNAATVFPNWPTTTVGASTAEALGANAWAESSWAGEGGDGGMFVAALPGFPSSDLNWCARGGGGMLGESVLEAFSSARGSTEGEGAYDSVGGDEGAFAAADPVTLAAEGTVMGKGFFGCAGEVSSPRTGTLNGTETIGFVPGSGPAILRGAAVWGKGATTVFGS